MARRTELAERRNSQKAVVKNIGEERQHASLNESIEWRKVSVELVFFIIGVVIAAKCPPMA